MSNKDTQTCRAKSEVLNHRYKGATPGIVVKALMRPTKHPVQESEKKQEAEDNIAPAQSSI